MEIKGKVHCLFEQEEWKDIAGFEGLYQVSNLGRIKSLKRKIRANTCGKRIMPERILTACVAGNGYFLVVLCKEGKHYNKMIHRLVAETFLPNPHKLKEVNHKDENKLNNNLSNLEWCDRKYNANYGTGVERQKITRANNPNDRYARLAVGRMNSKKIRQITISGEIIQTFNSMKEASACLGIHVCTISRHCLGLIHRTTLPFTFEYA